MELASCHLSCTYNFELATRFFGKYVHPSNKEVFTKQKNVFNNEA